jgi:hypothetical protein
LDFVKEREEKKGELKYQNKNYGFKVMTRQELDILINPLKAINLISDNEFEVEYEEQVNKKEIEQASIAKSKNTSTTHLIETQVEDKKKFTVLTNFL